MVCDCGVTWTDWATLAASAGTVFLAGVAWYQARKAKEQIDLGKGQLETAQDATQAAVDVHRESIRARIDQFASRVVCHFGAVGGPYYQSAPIDRAELFRLIEAGQLESAKRREFSLPRDERSYLWFFGTAFLANEGATTARIRLPQEARFSRGRNPFDKTVVEVPPFHKAGIHEEALLAPGEHAIFQWAAGRTVKDWAEGAADPDAKLPGGSLWFWTVVFDPRELGVTDTIMGHFRPEFLNSVPGVQGVWKVSESDFGTIEPLPIRRKYVLNGRATEDTSQMREYHGVDEQGRNLDPEEHETD